MKNNPKIIVALDVNNRKDARKIYSKLSPNLCNLKVGKELFTACGSAMVEEIHEAGYKVFLDLKFHDIPSTVMKSCEEVAKLGVWMTNVHVMGGLQMLKYAVAALKDSETILLGVTVLTSMNQDILKSIGINKPINEVVDMYSELCVAAGVQGVVCSPFETSSLKAKYGDRLLLVTPGIHLGHVNDSQIRSNSPRKAIEQGADYLVIGRAICESSSPLTVLKWINRKIAKVSKQ